MNNQLTIDELRAYQAGQLDGPARHRVERLLLEDPFYADALEGLEALQRTGASLPKQTAQLRRALHERINESATQRRLFPLWVTTMAASIVLVMGVALYFIYTNNAHKPVGQRPKLAKPEEVAIEMGSGDSAVHKTITTVAALEEHAARQRQLRKQETTPRFVSSPTGRQAVTTYVGQVEELERAIVVHGTPVATPEIPIVTIEKESPSNPRRVTHPERAFGPNPPEAPDVTLWSDNRPRLTLAQSSQLTRAFAESRTLPAADDIRRSSIYPAAMLTNGAEKKVVGTITNQQGEPLPGVQITIKGTNQGIATNATGQFSLDSALVAGRPLSVAYVGFKTQELNPLALKKGPVQLAEDTKALSEVVVTGYGRVKAERANMHVTELNETEVQSFRDYVKKEAASYFQGPLEVRVYTVANGSVRRVSVANGIRIQEPGQKRAARSYVPSPEVRDEAERLARQYPDWPKKRQTLLWITGWPVENRN